MVLLDNVSEYAVTWYKSYLQLFDYCLAPNTGGDGTGCDNMTCIIINFKDNLNNKRNSSTELDCQPEKRPRLDMDETTQGFIPTELGDCDADKWRNDR